MGRHILRDEASSCPISSSESQKVPTLAPPCKPYRQRRPNPLIGCVSLARLSILCTLSNSDRVVITWSPSSYTPVGPDCPDALSSPYLLITTWQLVKAHGVTRNEPKIHVICYITLRLGRAGSVTWMLGFPGIHVRVPRPSNCPLIIVSNVFIKNGTYPLMFIGITYNV